MDDQLKLLAHLLDAQTFALRTALAYQIVVVEVLKAYIASHAGGMTAAEVEAVTAKLKNQADALTKIAVTPPAPTT